MNVIARAQATPKSSVELQSAGEHPVDTMLQAFQMMQMHNSHVSTLVASTLGISATDLRALIFISSERDVTPKRTGDFLELTSGAITSLIDRMVGAGFVERGPNPNDRRSLVLSLAPDGVEAVEGVVDFYRRAFAKSVPADDVALLARTFRSLGESLAQAAREEIVRPHES